MFEGLGLIFLILVALVLIRFGFRKLFRLIKIAMFVAIIGFIIWVFEIDISQIFDK